MPVPGSSVAERQFRISLMQREFLTFFDNEDLKILLYVLAHHPDSERIIGTQKKADYARIIAESEDPAGEGTVIIRKKFPYTALIDFLLAKFEKKINWKDCRTITASVHGLLPEIRNEAVNNKLNVPVATEVYKREPTRGALRAARDEAFHAQRDLFNQLFLGILRQKKEKIVNDVVGEVGITHHSWERFLERFLQSSRLPLLPAISQGAQFFMKRMEGCFRRAKPVTLSPARLASRIAKYGNEPTLYLRDEVTRLMFVIVDRERKVLKTVYYEKR